MTSNRNPEKIFRIITGEGSTGVHDTATERTAHFSDFEALGFDFHEKAKADLLRVGESFNIDSPVQVTSVVRIR